ncbi:MAG: hypothetical protein ACYDDE_00385 [bacterium]
MDFKNFENNLVRDCATKHKSAVNTSLFMQKILKKIGILLAWLVVIFSIAGIVQIAINVLAQVAIFVVFARDRYSRSGIFPATPKNNWVVNMSRNLWSSIYSWLKFSFYADVTILFIALSISIVIAIIWALVYFLFIVPQKADKYINDKDS